MSALSIILLSSVKKLSTLNQERNMHRSSIVYKQNGCETTTGDGLFHWRKCYYGLWTLCIWVKNILMLDVFHLLSSPDVNWWTGVLWITCGLLWCFYQLFGLSFWRHPFTAEHPLLRHWCNATFLQIWWRNKLIYILDGLRVSIFFFFFGWTTPLNENDPLIYSPSGHPRCIWLSSFRRIQSELY